MKKFLALAVTGPPGPEQVRLVETKILSLFWNPEAFKGLIEYLEADGLEYSAIYTEIEKGFTDEMRNRNWWRFRTKEGDIDFIELVILLTDLDPRGRITAQDALQHKWFQDVPE